MKPIFIFSLTAIFTSIPISAHATTLAVISGEVTPTWEDAYSASPRFAVNSTDSAITRAWVEVDVEGEFINTIEGRQKVMVRKKIAGLAYDQKTQSVVFKDSNAAAGIQPIVCGTLEKGNFFRPAHVVSNRHCHFNTKIEKRSVDDGFQFNQKSIITINLIVE